RGQAVEEIFVLLAQPENGTMHLPDHPFGIEPEVVHQDPEDAISIPVGKSGESTSTEGRWAGRHREARGVEDDLGLSINPPLEEDLEAGLDDDDGEDEDGRAAHEEPPRGGWREAWSGEPGEGDSGDDELARVEDVEVIPPERRLPAAEQDDRNEQPQQEQADRPPRLRGAAKELPHREDEPEAE